MDYDQLTNLPNRRHCEHLIHQKILSSKQHQRILALIILDINNFKSINDNFGRDKGNKLLRLIADRLKWCLKTENMILTPTGKTHVARVDGDKFAVILEDIKDSEHASFVCQHILTSMKDAFMIEKNGLFITLNAGIAIYPDIEQSRKNLFGFSEEALKNSKQVGRNTYQYYTKALHEQHTNLLQLETELSQALEKNEFNLVYQPQVRLDNLSVVGAEVLIRWNHPSKGFISPEQFIPVAEHSGDIHAIGTWVIQTACKQWRDWTEQGIKLPRLAINLSSRQLNKANLMKEINEIVMTFGLKSENIEFEITETSIMQNGIVVDSFLHELKHAGYSLSIDDFGTGYSSLERLKKLPVTLLKIDKSFVDNLADHSDDYFIIKSIISLAHSLNLLVLAEGIETSEQLNLLKTLHCDIVQGYFFSKPLSPADFVSFIGKKILL